MKAYNISAKRMDLLASVCAAVFVFSPSVAIAEAHNPPSVTPISGVWTVSNTNTMPTMVDGVISFADDARVAITNEAQFAAAGERGVEIAVATCGIEGSPSITNYNFSLKMSGRIDLKGKSYTAANLVGEPDVVNAAPFCLSGVWTIEELLPLTVDGTLSFASGSRVVIADESILSSVGRDGVAIATATGGITGIPEIESYDYALKLSADGKKLIVYDNIPDVADWTVFTRKVVVAFGGVQQGVVLTNFPVLVKLSTAIPDFSYSDFKRPDGAELRFTDADGNYIPHEIEAWDTNGVSTVWVKVPRLSKDATVTAWYGYANPVRAMNPAGVWNENYLAVWHMNAAEGSLKQRDSTANGKTVSCPSSYSDGVMSGVTGKVGRAARCGLSEDKRGGFSISDNDGYFDGFGEFTVEAWTFRDSVTGALSEDGTIVRKGRYTSSWTNAWCIQENKSGKIQFYLYKEGNGVVWPASLTAPGFDAWHYHACRWSGTTGKYYLTEDASTTSGGSAPSSPQRMISVGVDGTLTIGNRSTNNNGTTPFCGDIDEVRISNVSRSAAWVKATYDTITDSNFATYAVEVIEPQYVFAKEVGVAFTGYSGSSALTDFPVLVRLSTNIPGFSYADFARANGGDLRFFDASGRRLSHEIDTWNPDGVSTVWVKVPTLSASTAITAKYGCDDPPDNDPGSVWSNGYVGVWHLGESGLPLKESSETSSGFSSKSGSTIAFAAPGVVGGSVDFSGGVNNSVVAADHDALDGFSKFTIELWTYQTEWRKNAGVLNKMVSDTSELAYSLFETLTDKGTWTMPIKVGTRRDAGTDWSYHQPPVSNRWSHTAFTVDMTITNNNIHGFKNGNMNSWVEKRNYQRTMPNCESDLCLGNSVKGASNAFPGKIDEVRISNVIRSADWVKATYDTVMKPDFATYSTTAGTLTGYAAWMTAKELVGAPDETAAKGVANGVRYAFDIDPEKGPADIGTPIIQVVRDGAGHPCVQARDLASGRSDVTFGILATENLSDWSTATLIPMKKFTSDSLWKPTASEDTSYVFPDKMFFKYKIDIQQ